MSGSRATRRASIIQAPTAGHIRQRTAGWILLASRALMLNQGVEAAHATDLNPRWHSLGVDPRVTMRIVAYETLSCQASGSPGPGTRRPEGRACDKSKCQLPRRRQTEHDAQAERTVALEHAHSQ